MTLYMDAAIGEAVDALKQKKMYAFWQHPISGYPSSIRLESCRVLLTDGSFDCLVPLTCPFCAGRMNL